VYERPWPNAARRDERRDDGYGDEPRGRPGYAAESYADEWHDGGAGREHDRRRQYRQL